MANNKVRFFRIRERQRTLNSMLRFSGLSIEEDMLRTSCGGGFPLPKPFLARYEAYIFFRRGRRHQLVNDLASLADRWNDNLLDLA